jgi:hypothetical protein
MSKELVPVSIMNYVPAFEYRPMQPYQSPEREPERKEEITKPIKPRKPKKENKTAPPEDF